MIRTRLLIPVVVLVLVISAGYAKAADGKLAAGSGSFIFNDTKGNADKPITVYYHMPEKLTPNRPIVFIMHGVDRIGSDYRDAWKSYADKYNFLLITPEFSKENWPGGRRYNRGNMYDSKGKLIEKSKWAFTAIEHLFDEVVKRTGSTQKGYFIFGHSAGGQFVHRMITFLPEARIRLAIAANPGWYTQPQFQSQYPYGLIDSPVTKEMLPEILAKPLVVMVGLKDNDPNHKHLYKSDGAMAQGKHRLERGRNYYSVARKIAKELGVKLRWRFMQIPNVAHSNRRMAKSAAKILANAFLRS